jgi:hypothetical protein
MKRVALLIVIFSVFTFAAAAPIEFTAELTGIESETDGQLVFSLNGSAAVNVWVTGRTDIRGKEGEPLCICELQVGMVLRVEGWPTESGVVASDIRVVETPNDFELKGVIQSVVEAERKITLLGFDVRVPEEAKIKATQARQVGFEDLLPGVFVKVEGKIEAGVMVATEVLLRHAGNFRASVAFEGVIEAIANSTLTVIQPGNIPTVVRVGLTTVIKGTPQVGALVKVQGWLAEDMAVEARQIIVQSPLMAVPQRIQMGVNQERRVQVVLRTPLEVDADLEIDSDGSLILAPETVTIPAGESSAFFLIASSTQTGSTTIVIRMPAALGGASAEVTVVIAGKGPGQDQKLLRLHFAPARLQIPASQKQWVALQVNGPVPEAVNLVLTFEGVNSDLIQFPGAVTIPTGANGVRFEVTAGTQAGAGLLKASSGDLSAEMQVEVRTLGAPLNPGRSGR